jgi:ubiquinone/menaquinone biosynthesis C-methylase UbiE
MSVLSDHINELKASEAFGKQAKIFDDIYGHDAIVTYKRQRVRAHALQHFYPGNTILELNCGTGEDAIFFAGKEFRVHATDISEDMLGLVKQKTATYSLEDKVSIEQCSFTELDLLRNRGPFDHVFSNLGGLNCTGRLDKVLASVVPLVKPAGTITLVMISNFCLWEFLLMFKGKFKTALRRLFAKKGRKAHIEGRFFRCWYYSPSYIKKHLESQFETVALEGLCTVVPPSFFEHFAEKRPKLFAYLKRKEDKLKSKWPWRSIGDYFIITLRKKSG